MEIKKVELDAKIEFFYRSRTGKIRNEQWNLMQLHTVLLCGKE